MQRSAILGVVTLLASALLAAEAIQYSRNSLSRNGRWVSSKTMMQASLMGSLHYCFTRNAVYRNRLDLGAWHGCNEVSFNRILTPRLVSFRFRLDALASVNLLFNRDESGYDGLRLSRNPGLPSILLHATRQGAFEARKPLAVTGLDSGWHQLEVAFAANELSVTLDRTDLGKLPVRRLPRQFVGFRGSLAPAIVDDVRIVDASGVEVVSESFRNERGYGAAVVVAVSTLGILALAAAWGLRRLGRTRTWREALLGVAAHGPAVLASIAMLFGFDYFFWSRLYPFPEFAPVRWSQGAVYRRVEELRARVFFTRRDVQEMWRHGHLMPPPLEAIRRSISAWNLADPRPPTGPEFFQLFDSQSATHARTVTGEVVQATLPKPLDTFRLGVLGTSQSFGVGAENPDDTWVSRMHRAVAAHVPHPLRVQTFNLSIPGSTSTDLLDRFRTVGAALHLDVLVVNVARNDADAAVLGANLQELARIAATERIRTVFLLEAVCPEVTAANLAQMAVKHRAVVAAGSRMHVPVLDLDGFLRTAPQADSGFLWWDQVHLTSYGQALAADWLTPLVLPYVDEAVGRPSRPPASENGMAVLPLPRQESTGITATGAAIGLRRDLGLATPNQ